MRRLKQIEHLNDETCIEYITILVRMKFRYVIHREEDFEDAIGDGLVGYLDAKRKYKDDKDCSFKTYAEKRIIGEIIDARRRKVGRKGQKDIIDFLTDSENENYSDDESTDSSDDYLSCYLLSTEFIESLDERDKIIVKLKIKGFNNREIASEIGQSPTMIHFRVKAIKKYYETGINLKVSHFIHSKPRPNNKAERKERNDQIRAMRMRKIRYSRIAEEFGLEISSVRRICKGLKNNLKDYF